MQYFLVTINIAEKTAQQIEAFGVLEEAVSAYYKALSLAFSDDKTKTYTAIVLNQNGNIMHRETLTRSVEE